MTNVDERTALQVHNHPDTGAVQSIQLYGHELLNQDEPSPSEMRVNGHALQLSPYLKNGESVQDGQVRLRGSCLSEHFSGWSLVLNRRMGHRATTKHPTFGISYTVRREIMDPQAPRVPGPGGPPIEAPLFADTISLSNFNWNFWGDDTRMIFPSAHSTGPDDEWGHVGYEHDSPEKCKKFLQNTWRRVYPGVMVIHGGVFYNKKTGHWISITCRRPQLGYLLNINDAGKGISYDYTLHDQINIGDMITIPEIIINWGADKDSMWRWMADYVFHFYRKTPAWMDKTFWMRGVNWDNQPTWSDQAPWWEQELERRHCNGISYSLVTARPAQSGTAPYSYEPDPMHGTQEEFKAMCQRMSKAGIPLLFWMSHSGLMYRGSDAIDDDWFIRGIDGRVCAAWGDDDYPDLCHINPGHPGYIAYTKKWLHFYIKECGCKGVFMDCLGWAFPPDYSPRTFMRYPGDTNRMAIRFIDEIAAYIKELDPEAVIFGEGTTFDAPVDLVTMHLNPKRGIDGMGPRDYLLELNKYHDDKRMVLDQGPMFSPAGGFPMALPDKFDNGRNAAMRSLIDQYGCAAFDALPDGLSLLAEERLLVVPLDEHFGSFTSERSFSLPADLIRVTALVETTGGERFVRNEDGQFSSVPVGIYKMEEL